MITSQVGLLTFFALLVSTAIWMERYAKFRRVGAAAAAIIAAMVFANIGLIPGDSAVYDFFTSYGVMASTVLILLAVDFASMKSAGSMMLKAFAIGAVGSALGASLMGYFLQTSLGENTYKLSGQFSATYIGGGMNFAAVGQAFGTDSEIFTAGIAADVFITAFWLVACLAAPALLGNNNTSGPISGDKPANDDSNSLVAALSNSVRPLRLFDVSALVAVTTITIWVSELLAGWMPALPSIIWLTTIVLVLAQVPTVKKLTGSMMFGNYLVIMFLACNGAQSVFSKIVEVGPAVLYFAAGTVAVHGIVIFGIGRMLRIDAATLAVASQANIGGGAQAMAIAAARGYDDRILPGVIVGYVGTATGNYIGLAIGNAVRLLTGH